MSLGADAILTDLGPGLVDFAETASILNQLDMLISIDTAVAHLAGALGIPTLLLLRKVSDWRWFDEGASSPRYPSFQLFRQKTEGRWDDPAPNASAVPGNARRTGDFLLARETALHLIDHPEAIDMAKTYIANFMMKDPHQRGYARLWKKLLTRDAATVALKLIEDSEQSQLLRETKPVFCVIDGARRAKLLAEARCS